MVKCQVPDCKNIDRETWTCQVNPDDLDHNDKGNCTNYVRDIEWLKEQWKYERPE